MKFTLSVTDRSAPFSVRNVLRINIPFTHTPLPHSLPHYPATQFSPHSEVRNCVEAHFPRPVYDYHVWEPVCAHLATSHQRPHIMCELIVVHADHRVSCQTFLSVEHRDDL